MTRGGDGSEGYGILWEIIAGRYIDRHICCLIPDDLIHLSQKGILKKEVYQYIGRSYEF